jgi:hypothetical protein
MKPNFFIIGAPKCGTTSIVSWLEKNPEIFISKPKEPNFFNTDHNDICRPTTLNEYEKLFIKVSSSHKAVGEASTAYLRSKVAVPGILKYVPYARFIICLRNPIEMAPSCHSQLVKTGFENEVSFKRAWALQDTRLKGKALPKLCQEPMFLIYRNTCNLGKQLKKVLQWVSLDDILFVLLEDLRIDPRREYLRILDFLGISDDGRLEFTSENVRSKPYSFLLSKMVRIASHLKFSMNIKKSTGIGATLQKWNNRNCSREQHSKELINELQKYFTDDIKYLSEILNRDLTHWLV